MLSSYFWPEASFHISSRAVMANILETKCPNCNPRSTHLSQSAGTAIKTDYWSFSVEKTTHTSRDFILKEIHNNRTCTNSLYWKVSLHLAYFCLSNVIFAVVCMLGICQTLAGETWLVCWLEVLDVHFGTSATGSLPPRVSKAVSELNSSTKCDAFPNFLFT